MIPDKLTHFMCYKEGRMLIGIVDVSLPDIAFMTESIKGAGILGELDLPVLGHLQSMTATINWRSLIVENISFSAPETYLLDFRGSIQIYNQGSGQLEPKSVKVVMKLFPKKVALGKMEVGTAMGTSGEFEVLYIKISVEGKEYLEADKVNFIYKSGGVDYLAKVRKDIGLE